MRRRERWGRRFVVLAFFLLGLGGGLARGAEEYVLGPEDVISITVWEHPELSRTAVVRANGAVTLPPLGDLPAAGKTTSTLARDLERQMYSSLRQTTQVTVSVVAFNSRKVFLAGQVTSPGRYSFEQMPDIVNLLGQAGGLGAGGDLSQVRILRRGDQGEQTLQVDLNKAIKAGDLSGLPTLQTGDVVFVPPTVGAGGGASIGDAVYVLGEVARPGSYSTGAGVDLIQALGLAGGATANSDLSAVEVLARDSGGGSYLLKVNLEEKLKTGSGGPEIHAGDTIRVPSRTTSPAYQAWNVLRAGLGTTRDVLNLVLIRDALKNKN